MNIRKIIQNNLNNYGPDRATRDRSRI
jgi:hypothetical protein